jgi:hypothetical protein
MKGKTWLVYAMAIPITHLFVLATNHTVTHMGGFTWGSRFVQFGAGIVSFAIMAWYFNNEGINLKTGISLFLVLILILIQLMWK